MALWDRVKRNRSLKPSAYSTISTKGRCKVFQARCLGKSVNDHLLTAHRRVKFLQPTAKPSTATDSATFLVCYKYWAVYSTTTTGTRRSSYYVRAPPDDSLHRSPRTVADTNREHRWLYTTTNEVPARMRRYEPWPRRELQSNAGRRRLLYQSTPHDATCPGERR